MVNCHGCKYQSKHYVPKNSVVTLEIPRMEPALPPRQVPGRVVWVQRPRTVRELFQIGLEFEIPGNVWGIAFPPEDWFPYPADQAAAAPATSPESPSSTEKKPVASQPKASAPATVLPEKKAGSSGRGPGSPGCKNGHPASAGSRFAAREGISYSCAKTGDSGAASGCDGRATRRQQDSRNADTGASTRRANYCRAADRKDGR